MNLSQNKLVISVIFVLIFVAHLLYIAFVQLNKRAVRITGKKTSAAGIYQIALFDDEDQYANLARNLINNHSFSLDGEKPTATRVPLWPLVLSLVFFFTNNATYALVVNCFLAALAALGGYILGRLYWSSRAGLLALILVGFSPHTFNWFLWLQAEALLAVLIIYFLSFFSFLIKYQQIRYAVLSGLCAGLATLTRPEALLIIPLYLGYLIYFFRNNRHYLWTLALPWAFSAGLVIFPWIVRNYVTMNYWGLSTIGGFTFSGGHNEITLTRHLGSWYAFSGYASPAEKKEVAGMDEVAFDKYLWQRGWQTIKKLNLRDLLYLELMKLLKTFKPSFRVWGKEYRQEALNLLLVAPYFLLYILFYFFLIYHYLILRDNPINITPLLLIFLVPITVSLIFWGPIRFRVPYEPVIFTITAGYIDQYWQARWGKG